MSEGKVGWRRWLRPRVKVRRKPPADIGVELRIEGTLYVFGMDWRMLPPTRRLSRALSLARQEGMRWYAQSEMQDIVGYLGDGFSSRGKRYSAPLHLASRFSRGGLELFVFAFGQKYGVIALQDSRPLPGYDVLCDPPTARAMVDEFLAIQRGQPIRLVGNTSWLEGQEPVEPEDLFGDPARQARLRSMRSLRAAFQMGMLVLLGGGVVLGSALALERWRENAKAELQSSPAYQQKIYAEALAKAWSSLPPDANVLLARWREVLERLPLVHQGWALRKVECDLTRCRVDWDSLYGSRADFLMSLPAGAQRVDDSVLDQDAGARTLYTDHDLSAAVVTGPAPREALPTRREARRQLGDWLQDLQLLGPAESRVEAMTLLGGHQDPSVLVDPVFMGEWSLRHDLWLLPSLRLFDFVRVHKLMLELPSRGKASGKEPVRDKEKPMGTMVPVSQMLISGSYYAKQ